ncbi:hypothetical protein BH11ARM2_BH11ARM2_06150 [soil metagenome]
MIMLPAPICLPALLAWTPTSTEIWCITFPEKSFTLRALFDNEGKSTRLVLKRRNEAGDPVAETEFAKTYADSKFAEFRLALPIRVESEEEPQVLTKLYRSNWLDISLISLRADGAATTFSFSCRDEKAIRWNVVKGRLASIVTYDRYAPEPVRVEKTDRIG